jgi:hypothetical protein
VEQAATHRDDPAAKLYLVGGPFAAQNLDRLLAFYPNAVIARHEPTVAGEVFWSVLVPSDSPVDVEAPGG